MLCFACTMHHGDLGLDADSRRSTDLSSSTFSDLAALRAPISVNILINVIHYVQLSNATIKIILVQ